jgi:hypothetical protein
MTKQLLAIIIGSLIGIGVVYALGPTSATSSACGTQAEIMEAHANSWQGISQRCDEIQRRADRQPIN